MDKTKKVKFNTIVSVVLIPEKKEYCEIKDSIWYNDDDFYNFLDAEYKRKKSIRIQEQYKNNIFNSINVFNG